MPAFGGRVEQLEGLSNDTVDVDNFSLHLY
jgi:hypothetical protein